jgi:hypothetical protein
MFEIILSLATQCSKAASSTVFAPNCFYFNCCIVSLRPFSWKLASLRIRALFYLFLGYGKTLRLFCARLLNGAESASDRSPSLRGCFRTEKQATIFHRNLRQYYSIRSSKKSVSNKFKFQ